MVYFAKINYLGTNFHGFQVQPGLRTVQGELCSALSEVFGAPAKVTGCSRTDAGVHANEFCLKIECDAATVPPSKLPIATARFLPTDMSLYYAEECDPNFHPRYDVVSKEYLYRIVNRAVYDPFEYGRAWFIPRNIDEAGILRMNLAAKNIIGKNDFSSFMSSGSNVKDTVRNVYECRVSKINDEIIIKITADGFLYNMVRIISGTLLEVGKGNITPEQIISIIESKDRSMAGSTLPAHGLYLTDVKY